MWDLKKTMNGIAGIRKREAKGLPGTMMTPEEREKSDKVHAEIREAQTNRGLGRTRASAPAGNSKEGSAVSRYCHTITLSDYEGDVLSRAMGLMITHCEEQIAAGNPMPFVPHRDCCFSIMQKLGEAEPELVPGSDLGTCCGPFTSASTAAFSGSSNED